ncbi:hypothetical protein HDU93_002295, partial [Gonapodya sp. JEL0774]
MPTEILLHIADYLDFRLGLPTGALTRRLADIFRTPCSIAARALAHFGTPIDTLVWESLRAETCQHLVVEAIYQRVSTQLKGFSINNTAHGAHGVKMTPIDAAAYIGNVNTVRFLLEVGADIHGWLEPIVWAWGNHHLEVVKLLMDNGAKLYPWQEQFLLQCSSDGQIDLVRFLLAQGADVDGGAANDGHGPLATGYGPLQVAARNGHSDVVSLLLDYGVDIHLKNDAALWNAVQYGRVEVVNLLLRRGA